MSVIAQPASPPIVVAIPARDEVDRIGACLRALAAQRGGPPAVLVLANNCTDGTAAHARSLAGLLPGLQVVEVALPAPVAHAGEARRLAMHHAARLCAADGAADGVLLTTDADAVAPPGWLAANLAALKGADAVCGRAVIDRDEARAIPDVLHRLDALECSYAALLDEIASLLHPDPHDPWPRHDEHSGASIAVTLAAYLRVGGIPRLRCGEDRAFVAALRRAGARVRHDPTVWVSVSGRLEGRAHGGMADTIRARIAQPPEWLDDRLEPLHDRVARLAGRLHRPMRRVRMSEVSAAIVEARAYRDRLCASAGTLKGRATGAA